jgi:peptidoglycan/LPS O-acetylase OafA/YrhL
MTTSTPLVSKIPANSGKRLHYLDGLRGIAIILVVFYHAYSKRWGEVLPYGASYDDIIIFQFGNYGVQLFFMISGFVIAMTLEKCQGFSDFMLRRWLRLFPAMFVGSCLILLASTVFLTARPYGSPHLQDVIPGLLFIEPEFFRALFKIKQGILEGSFWTLFVEMKFYIVSGMLYFTIGLRKMILVLILMFLSSIVYEFSRPYLSFNISEQLDLFYKYSNYQHYGWFAAGALFYQYQISKQLKYWLLGLLIALISARCLGGLLSKSMIVATSLVLIFAFSMNSIMIQKLLSNKVLVFFGFISYPFYLIHEQAMISMIRQLHSANLGLPDFLLPYLPIMLIVIVAWLIARYLEPATKSVIKNMIAFSYTKELVAKR